MRVPTPPAQAAWCERRRSIYTQIIFPIKAVSVLSLSYDFPNNTVFALTSFMVGMQSVFHITYKTCSRPFMLLVRLLALQAVSG